MVQAFLVKLCLNCIDHYIPHCYLSTARLQHDITHIGAYMRKCALRLIKYWKDSREKLEGYALLVLNTFSICTNSKKKLGCSSLVRRFVLTVLWYRWHHIRDYMQTFASDPSCNADLHLSKDGLPASALQLHHSKGKTLQLHRWKGNKGGVPNHFDESGEIPSLFVML